MLIEGGREVTKEGGEPTVYLHHGLQSYEIIQTRTTERTHLMVGMVADSARAVGCCLARRRIEYRAELWKL